MGTAYEHHALSDLETNPDKPSDRWEISRQIGITGYNLNVAVIDPGERLSQTAYHYHENQEEFFYCVAGACKVEVPDGSFRLTSDEFVVFREGAVHLLHNPFADPCKVIAIGYPPEGRRPVHMVKSYAEIIAERYPGESEQLGEE